MIDPKAMNPKERFDACMKLAAFWAGRADARRVYEWRSLLAFYALMTAIVVYLPRNCFSGIVVGFALLGFVWLFLRGNWIAATKDKVQAWHYSEAASEIASNPMYKVPNFDKEKKFKEKRVFGWWPFLNDWSQEVHIGVSFLFALAFWLLPQLAKLPQSN